MLQSTREDAGPWVAVSPDGLVVGRISSDDGLFKEDKSQIMFVEMKSRQSVDTLHQKGIRKEGKTRSESVL